MLFETYFPLLRENRLKILQAEIVRFPRAYGINCIGEKCEIRENFADTRDLAETWLCRSTSNELLKQTIENRPWNLAGKIFFRASLENNEVDNFRNSKNKKKNNRGTICEYETNVLNILNSLFVYQNINVSIKFK